MHIAGHEGILMSDKSRVIPHDSHRAPERKSHATTPLKVALYSHDAMGIGHVRRNLFIAQSLARASFRATTLMVCGIHEATGFCGGEGIDCITVPGLTKHGCGDYRSRDLSLSLHEVTSIRRATLAGALAAYRPDVFVVDKVPNGLNGELVDVLPQLRAQGTRLVLGVRDVLDSPHRVAHEWARFDYEHFIREHYDAVWIYGDRHVYDAVKEYSLHALVPQVRFTGYFDQRDRLAYSRTSEQQLPASLADRRPTTLCMVGGGQDGERLAAAFAHAQLPQGHRGLLITGPLMPAHSRQSLQSVIDGRADMELIPALPEADVLMPHVDRVICMGGYNTTLSTVSFEKPSLIVPRVHPRQEQWIRAKRFEERELLQVLHPDELSADRISAWLARPESHFTPRRDKLDLGGGQRVCELVQELVGTTPLVNSPAN
ncbi:MAG: hypothetical protein KDA60_00555 [Planctomycetales bacterium]|nr:hypothetical protein [Planctomycetales bacterium]